MNNISQISFKGYDARELQGLYITDSKCVQSLKRISRETGIDIYTPNIASKSVKKDYTKLQSLNRFLWAQDYLTFIKNKVDLLLFDREREDLSRVLKAAANGINKDFKFNPGLEIKPHLRGGNFFIINKNGKQDMLLSENKKDIYPKEMLKGAYDVENIHYIPRLDYHMDLYLRPLKDGNVLVADDSKTIAMFNSGIEKLTKYLEENELSKDEKEEINQIIENIKGEIQKFEITNKFNEYKPEENLPKIISALKDAGCNPIPIPANHYYLDIYKNSEKAQERIKNFNETMEKLREDFKHVSEENKIIVEKYIAAQTFKIMQDDKIGNEIVIKYENNFINAIVTEKDGKLIYITNAPLLDKKLGITPEIEAKTGFSTKQCFIDSVKDYIDKENIYFIDDKTTEHLFKYMGGIHCTAAEIVK